MKLNRTNQSLILNRIPPIGILCFGLLYAFASTLYPGGSQADVNSVGFDWVNNYWCNMMNESADNGEPNPARRLAIFSMVLLCSSLGVFFYQFAEYLTTHHRWKMIIKIAGILSMVSAAFMFTQFHDVLTIISSFFGLFVLIGILLEIFRRGLLKNKLIGLLCLILLGMNNYIYYTEFYIKHLPLIQKITFIIVLLWIVALNFEVRREIKNQRPIL